MKRTFLICCLLFVLPLLGAAQTAIKISHGPYLQGLGTNETTIVWTTNKKAISWVELAPDDSTHFYLKVRPKVFSSKDGFKLVDTVHRVKLSGLQPNTKYRYRIYSQEVLSHVGTDVQYGKVVATAVYKKEPLTFSTINPNAQKTVFGVINDIHGRNEVMENLLANLNWKETDLVFFNGDMADNLRSETQMFGDYMDTAVKLFASEKPFYYARGNHETRGNFAKNFADYFPTPDGRLYYIFRQGPVLFIVLDPGEDKPDTDIEYSGIVDFDNYRTQEAAWLKTALAKPEYKDAKYKVVVCHVPPFGGWHGEQEIAEKFVPLLNEAKAQVMIAAHLHRHVKKAAEPGKHQFPIMVNSNMNMVKASADQNKLLIQVLDQKGKVVDSMEILPNP